MKVTKRQLVKKLSKPLEKNLVKLDNTPLFIDTLLMNQSLYSSYLDLRPKIRKLIGYKKHPIVPEALYEDLDTDGRKIYRLLKC